MSRSIAVIVADLERADAQVSKLEAALDEARVQGKALFLEFKAAQGVMGSRFGIEAEVPRKRTPKTDRKPRPVGAGLMTSATRQINNAQRANKSAKEAKEAATAAVKKLAARHGGAVPVSVSAAIDAKIKEVYGRK